MLRCITLCLKCQLFGDWLYLVLNEAVVLRTNWFSLKSAPNLDFSTLWELHEAWLLLLHYHRFVRLLFSLLAHLFLPLQTLQVLVFTFEKMGHWASDHQHKMWIPIPVSPAAVSLCCLPVQILHCPGKSWKGCGVVEGVKRKEGNCFCCLSRLKISVWECGSRKGLKSEITHFSVTTLLKNSLWLHSRAKGKLVK